MAGIRESSIGIAALPATAIIYSGPAFADPPLSYLSAFGPKADSTASLTWGLLIISILVTAVMTGLVIWAIFRKRAPVSGPGPEPETHHISTFNIFGWGLGLTALILAGCVGWTMMTLAAIDQPPKTPAVNIEVTGNQWWWRVRYLNDEPSKNFDTANEMHIPAGEPVKVTLRSEDVIHSFWVPSLSGKTDVIPGQLNTTWIEAREPGTYQGQCGEYCGLQHAHMQFKVIADKPADYLAWRDNQLKLAPTPAPGDPQAGLVVFEKRCGACHAVRGTMAGGYLGPNLSHLMTRSTLAAGTLPADQGDLAGWISDPQSVKPGTRMPHVPLSGDEMQLVITYLSSLN
ncbi:cytochrome c oxidase subunit II [Hyphomicrobium sp.]|uniref:cytochrome c oxidase subunit II n=1 Tax=Hyphomicrobium sp. TaxID=82 RepID=UPI002D792022|nr:cytochrome c oxidase subunit II [Hyphomicrobium sp.]HET6390035.1 cytochrome c oxidase subunit II [Hyphomicrobium sp.]